jgi:uncharacterized protein (TIGR03437 family)
MEKNQDRRSVSVAAVLVVCAGTLVAQLPVADGEAKARQLNSHGTGITPAAVPPQISPGGIVNGASFKAPLARCGLATLFGTNLADTPASATLLPLPTTLGGTQVLVNGIAAPLFYVSPGQINFQVPCEAPLNGAVGVYVASSGGNSPAQSPTIAPYAPGVFTYARTATAVDPIIVHLDNSLVTPDKPANPGEVLIVYATGVGNLNHLPVTGAASPASPLAAAVDLPSVTVGSAAASVSFAGLTPGMVGLVQINTQLPSTFPAGSSLPLVVSFAGAASPAVNLAVQGGSGAPSGVLVSDSFNRADATACALGKADLALGGSGSHYYLPLVTTSSAFGVGISSGALQNNSTDYSGVQFTASSDGCGNRTSGEGLGQDLDIKVDLLLPASSAGMVQAGPYFRSSSVDSGAGVLGTTGYWVFLTNKGEVRVRKLTSTTTNTITASTNIPASFDASVYHTLETVVRASTLQVYLDGKGLSFLTNCANNPGHFPDFVCTGSAVTTVSVPTLEGRNDGSVGIAFGDEDNRGKLAGQRAKNLVIAQAP